MSWHSKFTVMAEAGEEKRTRFRDFSQVKSVSESKQAGGQQPTYFPGVQVETPSMSTGDIDTAKMGMLFSIIGGIIALAFAIGRFMTSELDSDMEFLYLSSGAGLLVLFSYGFVEVQHRRHGRISIVHDYVLSFGHLFAVLGGFWITRWGLFFYCGYSNSWVGTCHANVGTDGWMPGEWGALIQAIGFVMIGYSQWRQNERVGATMLPRLVTVLSPLVILFIGAEIWVNWSMGYITLPILLSALLLTGIGMWLGSTSNRAPLFLGAAFLSSIIPLVYELKVGGGAGLSLLAMVVLMQGIFASAQGLSRSMIQHGSIVLIIIILVAEFWAVVGGLNLIIVDPIENVLISLPMFIWLSLLLGYFIPVHMRRVPWMPIGLAVGLSFLPAPGSGFAWALAIIAFVYMLNKPQTRRWVSDWTFSMLATSWFIVDWLSSFNDGPFTELALDPVFLIVPPAALLFIGGIGSEYRRMSKAPYHLMIVLTLFSHEMLFGSGAYLPLAFVGYLLFLIMREASMSESIDLGDTQRRKDVSILVLVTGASLFILEWMGRLDSGLADKIGVTGLGVEALIGSIILYALGRSLRDFEFDIGKMVGTLLDSTMQVNDWNPSTGQWSSNSSKLGEKLRALDWGPAMRGSMVMPLLIFSLAAADMTETWAVFLLVLPIIVLSREILFELPKDNRTRAAGIWLLFFVGLPWSFRIHQSLFDSNASEILLVQIIFDVMMLAGPLLGQFMLTKQGVVKEEGSSADWLLIGTMMVAMLDVSGGILFIGMMILAITRSLQHRRMVPLNLMPIFWAIGCLFLGLLPKAIVYASSPEIASLLLTKNSLFLGINYPAWVGLGWIIIGAIPLIMFIRDIRLSKGDEARAELAQFPILMPALSVVAGLHLLVSDPYMLMLVVVVIAGIGAWSSGQLAAFWIWPLGFALSLQFAEEEGNWFVNDAFDITWTIASLVTWIVTILFWKGIMQSRAPEANPGKFEVMKGGFGFDAKVSHQETRVLIANVQLAYAVFFSLIGMGAFYGIVFLISAFVLSARLWHQRHAKLLFAAVIIETIAVINLVTEIDSIEQYDSDIGGMWLLLSGLLLTWASWRNWDFEWNEISNDKVLEVSNHSGIAGAIYVPIAALLLSDAHGIWLFGAVLAVFGGLQMMIGFEKDERWRRIYTLVSIPLGILIVAGDISNGVLQGVMYLLAALTLFGQGFLYMMRAGVEVSGTASQGERVAEPFTSELSIQPQHDEEESSEDTTDVDDEETSTQDVEEEPQSIPEPVLPVPSRFDSGEGFDVELPLDVLERIRQALSGAQYDGYKPIVKWDAYGQVILDFEQINN
ncbi:MAG: hypothetical protein HOE69_01655 [Euryarchaeota archaeon]|jgi:hypothetical protein|nr:hypothetical protein [Euryarchaeota archaeon]